ncbi:hypothetical protein UT300012_32080 [Paraclostridium bifermentans]
MDWYENLKKMIKVGRYPNKEAMELKITNFVGDGLITVEQGIELKELLDQKEGK